jgi:homopolymeric O-antigen transport system permease protein
MPSVNGDAREGAHPIGATAGQRVIQPKAGWSFPDLREVWDRRYLIFLLARRDIALRYRQSIIGTFWAVLQPVLLAAVLSVFMGELANVRSQAGIPYPLFAISGMVMWLFFTTALTNCSMSTVGSSSLISKVYFPRLVVPLAAAIRPTVDFAIAFIIVLGVALLYGFYPDWRILLLPAVVFLALATALGFGLWLSAINVKYRDVTLVIPFVVLVGLFVTPVIYPFDRVPSDLRAVYALNPMVGVLEAYRWMLLGTEWPGRLILVPILSSMTLVISGLLYFRRAEQNFVDVI